MQELLQLLLGGAALLTPQIEAAGCRVSDLRTCLDTYLARTEVMDNGEMATLAASGVTAAAAVYSCGAAARMEAVRSARTLATSTVTRTSILDVSVCVYTALSNTLTTAGDYITKRFTSQVNESNILRGGAAAAGLEQSDAS